MLAKFYQFGDPNKPTIVFLCDKADRKRLFNKHTKALTDFHCIVPDLDECFLYRTVNVLSLKEAAAQLSEMIRRHCVYGKAHLIGLSDGTQLVLQMMLDYPQAIITCFVTGELYPKSVYRQTAETLIQSFGRFSRSFTAYFHHDSPKWMECPIVLKKEHLTFPLPSMQTCSLKPILVVAGEYEGKMTFRFMGKLLKSARNSTGIIVRDSDCHWTAAHPELFNQLLISWIRSNKVPNSSRFMKFQDWQYTNLKNLKKRE